MAFYLLHNYMDFILLSVILIAIGFSFIGEFYIYYLDNFASTFYATDMYHNDAISAEQMKEDVSSAAAESNVNYFLVKHNIESALKKTITIYADEPTLSLINEESQVQQGEYQSFFLAKRLFFLSHWMNMYTIILYSLIHFI